MSTTPNRHLPLMESSQAQPEVVYNAAMEILDIGTSLEVESSGASPGVREVIKLKFIGASVTEETGGVAVVTIDPTTGSGSSAVFLQLSGSDLVSALTTGTEVAYVRAPHAFTITDVRASLSVASSSGIPAFDVKKNGSTIFSSALTIDATEKTSVTAATPAVLGTTAISDDDEITVDITAAGTGAKGLIISIIGHT